MSDAYLNAVSLRGRVSQPPSLRELPSGDEILSFTLVVPRPPARRRGKVVSDTIECVAWTAALRRRVRRLTAGDEVQVDGALRRRFTRGGGGPVSFTSVELTGCRPLDS